MGNHKSKTKPFNLTLEEEKILNPLLKSSSLLVGQKEILKESGNGLVCKQQFQLSESKVVSCITKTPVEYGNFTTFKKQIFIQIKLGAHKRIVDLYGIILPEFTMIYQFMNFGDLEKLLKSHLEISQNEQIIILTHVAEGMEFIHSKNIIHRDLAARNIVLNKNEIGELETKITDLGQALELPPNTTEIQNDDSGPIRICAPEVLEKGIHSKASDVWSYGVLLYSVFAKERPYPQIERQQDVRSTIIKGLKLDFDHLKLKEGEKLTECIKYIFYECIKDDRNERISFSNIVISFHKLQTI